MGVGFGEGRGIWRSRSGFWDGRGNGRRARRGLEIISVDDDLINEYVGVKACS